MNNEILDYANTRTHNITEKLLNCNHNPTIQDIEIIVHNAIVDACKWQKEQMLKDSIPAKVLFDFSDPMDIVCRRLYVDKKDLDDALLKFDMNDAPKEGLDIKLTLNRG